VACFWPLTDEFWDRKHGMKRCRACHRARDAARGRARYLASTTVRERKREASRRYRQANPQAQRLIEKARWLRIISDPELHAHKNDLARERKRRYRARQRALAA
jgi:hypothetical protein